MVCCPFNCLVQFCELIFICCGYNFVLLCMWEINWIWLYSIHIQLTVWQLSVNLIKIFLMCVVGKQWETLRFTIEVCSSRVLWLIAHYCAVAGIILIFRFLPIWSCTCRSCCERLRPTVRPILHMGNEMSMNIGQVKKLRKIVRMKKLATSNSKIFVCTTKKTSVNYRTVLTLLPCFYPQRHFKIYNNDLCISLFSVLFKAVHWLLPLKSPAWSRGEEGIHSTPTVQYWSLPEEDEVCAGNYP